MNRKIAPVKALLILIFFSFAISCQHDPIASCDGVDIQVSVIKTDADPDKKNGTIVVIANGPAKFFTYSINNSEFQASDRFAGLDSGTYTITVKNSWECKGTKETRVDKVYVDPCVGVSFTTTVSNATIGKTNGSITGTIVGGTGYTYSINTGAFQSSSTFTGLAAGNYTLTAKNSNGCLLTSQATVGENNPCIGVSVTVTAATTDPTLNQSNGKITASATGGSSFTYSLNSGAFQPTGIFTGLMAGNYLITAKSADGCSGTTQAILNGVNPCAGVTVTVAAATTNPTLNQSDGTITASATGGSGFTYSINNGAFQSGGNFTGLAAGNYSVTAKSADGCSGTAQVVLSGVNSCAGITVAVTTTVSNPTLNQSDGSITASATGGTGFSYSLNNGTFQSSGLFSGLASGNYTIAAKSAAGCIGTTQVALGSNNPCAGVTIAVTGAVTDTPIGQTNGVIALSATGGTGFTFSLNNGAFQSSGTFTSLAAGNYSVIAKSSAGCLGTAQFTVASINPCAGVTVVVTGAVTDATTGQSNGNIAASATGGSGFTFSLNNGAYQSNGTFAGLAAGTYTITAKNSSGCLGSASFTIASINPCAGVTIGVTAVVTNAGTGQSNGSIVASATGGTGFTFSLNGGAYQSSGTFTGLAAGNYTVTAKTPNGCVGSASFTVVSVNVCAAITISVTATTTISTNCVTPGTGTISASASGSSGFTFNLNNGAYQASGTFAAVSPGTYTVGAKDLNGCTSSTSVTVGTTVAGITFSALKVLVQTRCSGTNCHTNGKSNKGYNFDTDCNIVKAWNGINGSCITGTLNTMPISPQVPLTTAEKKIITDWITAGHGFAN